MLDEAFYEFNNSAFHLVLMLFLDFVSKYLYSNACKGCDDSADGEVIMVP